MDCISIHKEGLGPSEEHPGSLKGPFHLIPFFFSEFRDKDSNNIQQYFSSERLPTLWRALPAIEQLQTAWEHKRDSPQFAPYYQAITDGLAKLQKYYSRFDQKPAYILALGE
jgi:hypothetical protein